MRPFLPIVLGALCAPAFASAVPCVVDTSGAGTHTSLGAALNPGAGCTSIDIVDAVLNERVIGQTNVTINGAPTTIDGAGAVGGRVFDVSAGVTVVFNSISLTGGDVGGLGVRATGAAIFNGGGIHQNRAVDGAGAFVDGSLELVGARVLDNEAVNDGGGIFLADDGDLTLRAGARVRRNVAGRNGGGLLLRNPAAFEDSDVINNVAGADGGGFALRDAGRIDAVRLQIDDNRAVMHGGGIHAFGTLGFTLIVMEDSVMQRNRALNGSGGAIDALECQTVLTGGVFSDNAAPSGSGGAMRIRATGFMMLILSEATVAQNEAAVAGGIFLEDLGSAVVSIAETSIENNIADVVGGVGTRGAFLSLVGVEVRDNDATVADAGGVSAIDGATLEIRHSIVAGNKAIGNGGGLHLDDSEVLIEASAIGANAAGKDGGGVFAVDSDVALLNATIGQNTAAQRGGGIWLDGAPSVAVQYATIIDNEAGVDGNQVWASNCVVDFQAVAIGAENISPPGASDCSIVSLTSEDTHDLDGTCTDAPLDGDVPGPSVAGAPLGLPTFSGGAYAPVATSRLNAAVTVTPCPAQDQLGTARPAINCTVGAVE